LNNIVCAFATAYYIAFNRPPNGELALLSEFAAEPELAVDTPRQKAKHLTLFCECAADADSAFDVVGPVDTTSSWHPDLSHVNGVAITGCITITESNSKTPGAIISLVVMALFPSPLLSSSNPFLSVLKKFPCAGVWLGHRLLCCAYC
jgi:hypothetical protein